MRTIIIDDNKQAVKDLNERLARFSEVEVVAAEHPADRCNLFV